MLCDSFRAKDNRRGAPCATLHFLFVLEARGANLIVQGEPAHAYRGRRPVSKDSIPSTVPVEHDNGIVTGAVQTTQTSHAYRPSHLRVESDASRVTVHVTRDDSQSRRIKLPDLSTSEARA